MGIGSESGPLNRMNEFYEKNASQLRGCSNYSIIRSVTLFIGFYFILITNLFCFHWKIQFSMKHFQRDSIPPKGLTSMELMNDVGYYFIQEIINNTLNHMTVCFNFISEQKYIDWMWCCLVFKTHFVFYDVSFEFHSVFFLKLDFNWSFF